MSIRYVKIDVTAGSKKENFIIKTLDHFEVLVKEKADKNMANRKVIELVARHLKVPINTVRIVNGHHHPRKLLAVDVE
ncbi:DUF167 domain-containing protein [Patescibacteria group bacterium]|nr:DUF167 domain-containing protein [Patescibacteria group bacterium]